MDDHQFDALTRSIASARNRRQLLKGMLGLGSGLVASTTLRNAQAARRPTPTPRPVQCPGEQSWNGNACVCPEGKVSCGPDCCAPGVSECCDNACCFGTCYDEELCCPTGSIVCDGVCREWECCTGQQCPSGICSDDHTCCTPSCEGVSCGGSDGCSGSCGCPLNEVCIEGSCVCRTGMMRCANGACQKCCDSRSPSQECAQTQGGDAACWTCGNGICLPLSYTPCGSPGEFCSADDPGECMLCVSHGEICNSFDIHCCAGLECALRSGSWGRCVDASR